ncbi:hypothetical protein [Sphingopyxis sp. PET50]|uniref:hypothetical protein n=1 Tax=Sphingopyxis sp. PET50 TaxID=2976533 RepID=UPI0021AF44E5|nr:hypothetical protein [Sphingopyxis sp. PET50]
MIAKLRPLIAALLISTAGFSGFARAAADDGRQQAEVAALIDQWADARVSGDVDFLERFYAAELRDRPDERRHRRA